MDISLNSSIKFHYMFPLAVHSLNNHCLGIWLPYVSPVSVSSVGSSYSITHDILSAFLRTCCIPWNWKLLRRQYFHPSERSRKITENVQFRYLFLLLNSRGKLLLAHFSYNFSAFHFWFFNSSFTVDSWLKGKFFSIFKNNLSPNFISLWNTFT